MAGIRAHHGAEAGFGAGSGADAAIAHGVLIADVVAKAVAGGPDDNPDLEAFARATGELGLTADAYDDVCSRVEQRFGEVAGRFS